MHLRPFERDDFPTYQSWFEEEALNRLLGPMDEEWLAFILQDSAGTQFSLLLEQQLIGVAGVQWATELHPSNVITDIAIASTHRSRGIGKAFIQLIIEQQHNSHPWKAFVSRKNATGIRFFNALNWHCFSPEAPEQMLEFTSPFNLA